VGEVPLLPIVEAPACPRTRRPQREHSEDAALMERRARVRELALAGMPWPAIAAAVGLSPSRVRQLCAEFPRRKSGRFPTPRQRPLDR
jgi:hypothetical protein